MAIKGQHPMQNLLDPAILFFVFGVLAGALKSNLEIPPCNLQIPLALPADGTGPEGWIRAGTVRLRFHGAAQPDGSDSDGLHRASPRISIPEEPGIKVLMRLPWPRLTAR